MAKQLKAGDEVYVPLNRLGVESTKESAFLHTKVLFIEDGERSVTVDLLQDGASAKVASSAVHRNIGVLILCVGDILTEDSLLEPLRKSVLQYFRLLLPGPALLLRSIRSTAELSKFWEREHQVCSHVVLLGHGSEEGIEFAVDGCVSPKDLGTLFTEFGAAPKHFLSLCCRTGLAPFARGFCTSSHCESFIGPFHSVHGAVASQFLQNYFGHHFLDGRSVTVAFTRAQDDIPGGIRFKFWNEGALKKSRTSRTSRRGASAPRG